MNLPFDMLPRVCPQPCVRGGCPDQSLDQRRSRIATGGAVFHDTSVWLGPA